jgi:hypothetical protein
VIQKLPLRKPVGLSFYAFFANKNDDPELLMEVAHWWIMEMKLDHFEKQKRSETSSQLCNTLKRDGR